jgi:hypothetical protein
MAAGSGAASDSVTLFSGIRTAGDQTQRQTVNCDGRRSNATQNQFRRLALAPKTGIRP